MKTQYKVIGGSLVGAVAIHVAFVACGHSLDTHGGSDAGSEASLLDVLVDRVSTMLDGTTPDAHAGVDAGACGCTASTPASENPAQLMRGSLPSLTTAGTIVATGPFVLTDAASVSSQTGVTAGAALVLQPAAATCSAVTSGADSLPGYLTATFTGSPSNYSVHGGRFVVPSGQMLCAYNPFSPGTIASAELQWAGFTPYP